MATPQPNPVDDLVEAFDKEALVKRNPHADFPTVQASRLDFEASKNWAYSKTPNPTWQPGDGASSDDWKTHKLLAIDPLDPTRTANANYKLMISSTVPRPIALVSTVTADGSCQNVAPFSYFNTVSVDPPLYSVSFVGKDANDSLNNTLATGEMCISIVSDWFLEAANFTSVNTPPQMSEWPFAGLHPIKSRIVKPPYAAESAFSMECKLHSSIPILSKTDVGEDGLPVRTATLVLVEAVMYHVREDVIDKKLETIDIEKLRPVWRGGGITYGACFDGWETPRPEAFSKLLETTRVQGIVEHLGE
jgi:flavin reductase (DIM6/NTAB) family NADH-FMN oxidoreductase RutF